MSKTVRIVTYSLTEEDSQLLERLLRRFADSSATSKTDRFRSFLRRLEETFPYETKWDNPEAWQ